MKIVNEELVLTEEESGAMTRVVERLFDQFSIFFLGNRYCSVFDLDSTIANDEDSPEIFYGLISGKIKVFGETENFYGFLINVNRCFHDYLKEGKGTMPTDEDFYDVLISELMLSFAEEMGFRERLIN